MCAIVGSSDGRTRPVGPLNSCAPNSLGFRPWPYGVKSASPVRELGKVLARSLPSVCSVRLRVEPVHEFVFQKAPKFGFPLAKRVRRDVTLSGPAGDGFLIQTKVFCRFPRIHRSRTARRADFGLIRSLGWRVDFMRVIHHWARAFVSANDKSRRADANQIYLARPGPQTPSAHACRMTCFDDRFPPTEEVNRSSPSGRRRSAWHVGQTPSL